VTTESHLRGRLPGTVPSERIAAFTAHRHDSALVARLLFVPDVTSSVADALDEFGVGGTVPGHQLARTAGNGAICGPAVTLRYAALGGDVSSHKAHRRGLVIGDPISTASPGPATSP
jgi:hypothetical protein